MNIGFIGCGNMAGAMIQGILDAQICAPGQIMASALKEETLQKARRRWNICVSPDNRTVAGFADVLCLTVKPQFYDKVIGEIRDALQPRQIIVTVAPGKTLACLEEALGKGTKIIRTMPNTPAMVKKGMTAICPNEHVTQEELETVRGLFKGFSETEIVAERLMDTVTGISGSSPAYVCLFIEAMADAAVSEGMPRTQAYKFAAQAILGSAQMVLETGIHPGELKDMVCSPGGTTIEAVRVLEEKGFRSAVMEAVKACVRKSRQM